jgi:ParB-like chromosome segregation protein Spo0J
MSLTVENLAIDSLIPYAKNSRTHSSEQVAQVAASIKEFGWTNPVLIDEAGGIIAGHGRVMAAKTLGMVDIPCIRLSHLTEAQKRAYVIADNQLALNSGWNDELLAFELGELKDEGFNLALTGFDDGTIEKLLSELNQPKESPRKTKEINPDNYQMGCRCPRCGFEFNNEKA